MRLKRFKYKKKRSELTIDDKNASRAFWRRFKEANPGARVTYDGCDPWGEELAVRVDYP